MSDTIQFQLRRQGRETAPGPGLETWAKRLQSGMAVSMLSMPIGLRTQLSQIVERIASRNNNRWPAGNVGLATVSGDLLRTLREGIRISGAGGNVTGSISGVEYVRIQEYGGELRPRGTQFLAVPLPAALTSNGTPIKPSPRDWDNTFVQRSKAGHLLIFRRVGAGITPLYALKTSVKIPPRLGARQTLREQMPYFTSRVIDSVLGGVKAA